MGPRSFAILCVAFATLLLAGLYCSLKISLGRNDAARAHSHTYYLSVSAPRPGEESPIFQARQGDTITLVIRSDRPGELHVHAYEEQKIALKPGGEVRLTFTPKDAGGFPVHLHDPDGSMHDLGILEVQPK